MKNMLKHSKKQKITQKGNQNEYNPKYAKKRSAKNKCKSAREALALNMLGGGDEKDFPSK